MNLKIRKQYSILYNLGITMILYYSMNFPYAVEYLIGLFLGIFIFIGINNSKFKIPKLFIVVIFFSITYFGLQTFIPYTKYKSIVYATSIILLFLFGYNWGNGLGRKYESFLLTSIKAIYMGMGVYIVLCIIYTIFSGHIFLAFSREPLIFWNASQGNSTHFSTLSAVPMAAASYGILVEKKKKKVINIVILISVLIANMLMANRVSILFAFIFAMSALYLTSRNQITKKRIIMSLIILFLIIIIYIAYAYNVFGFKDILMYIPLVQRSLTLQEIGYSEPRIERQLYVLQNFFKYTNGGGYYNMEVGELHNVWLDIYDYAGILPFIFFIYFTIFLVVKMYKYKKYVKNNNVIGYLLTIMFAFFVSFVEEPVFRSCEAYTLLFFFTSGLYLNYIKIIKITKNNGEHHENCNNINLL